MNSPPVRITRFSDRHSGHRARSQSNSRVSQSAQYTSEPGLIVGWESDVSWSVWALTIRTIRPTADEGRGDGARNQLVSALAAD